MPALEGEALLDILGEVDIPDYIMDIDPNDLPCNVDQIRKLHALALWGDANAIHLLFLSHAWCMCNKLDMGGEQHRLEQKQAWVKKKSLRKRQSGGYNRALQKVKEAKKIRMLLYPLLAKCDAELAPENKQRGWRTFKRLVSRELNKLEKKERLTKKDYIHPLRKYLTEHYIQAWIREGRPSRAE